MYIHRYIYIYIYTYTYIYIYTLYTYENCPLESLLTYTCLALLLAVQLSPAHRIYEVSSNSHQFLDVFFP